MSVEVLHQSSPVARKEHACSTCGRTIRKGEQYDRQDNVFDGRRYAYKNCAHCQVASSRAISIDGYNYWDEGINYDYIEETLCDQRQTLADIRMLIGLRRRWTHADGSLWALPDHQPTDPRTTEHTDGVS